MKTQNSIAIIAKVDQPDDLADRYTGHRDRVLRLEPRLRVRRQAARRHDQAGQRA